jgi:hypothetical protein
VFCFRTRPSLRHLRRGPRFPAAHQNLSHSCSGEGSGGFGSLRVEGSHVHVLPGQPLGAGDVPQPGGGQVEAWPPIRERANHAGSPANFLHDALKRVVGPDLLPVDVREGGVGQRFADARLDQLGRPRGAGGPENRSADATPGLAVTRFGPHPPVLRFATRVPSVGSLSRTCPVV